MKELDFKSFNSVSYSIHCICVSYQLFEMWWLIHWNEYRPIVEFVKPSLSKNEAKYQKVKMSFICIRIKNHFHANGFALSLALKQRLEAMRKCPIWWLCSLQKVSIKLQHSLSCFAIFNNHNIFINFVLSVLVAQIKSLPLKTSNQGHSISLGKVVL